MFSPCGPLLVQVEKNYTLQRKHYRVFGLVSKVNLDSVSRHRPSAGARLRAGATRRHDPYVRPQSLPVIDITASSAPETIRDACKDSGFFYVLGHGVDEALSTRLEELSREFFAKPRSEKLAIRMELGGRAWRGYFPVGSSECLINKVSKVFPGLRRNML